MCSRHNSFVMCFFSLLFYSLCSARFFFLLPFYRHFLRIFVFDVKWSVQSIPNRISFAIWTIVSALNDAILLSEDVLLKIEFMRMCGIKSSLKMPSLSSVVSGRFTFGKCWKSHSRAHTYTICMYFGYACPQNKKKKE